MKFAGLCALALAAGSLSTAVAAPVDTRTLLEGVWRASPSYRRGFDQLAFLRGNREALVGTLQIVGAIDTPTITTINTAVINPVGTGQAVDIGQLQPSSNGGVTVGSSGVYTSQPGGVITTVHPVGYTNGSPSGVYTSQPGGVITTVPPIGYTNGGYDYGGQNGGGAVLTVNGSTGGSTVPEPGMIAGVAFAFMALTRRRHA